MNVITYWFLSNLKLPVSKAIKLKRRITTADGLIAIIATQKDLSRNPLQRFVRKIDLITKCHLTDLNIE